MFIEIGSRLKILDPSPELIKWCKENLEMTNPEYQQKARMHLWLGNTPRTLYLYEVNGNSLILPFGCLRAILPLLEGDMKKLFKEPKKVDYGGKVPLYDYQEEAVAAMLINHYGILQSPAGSGKTQMGIDGKEQPIAYDYVDCIRSLQKSFKQRCTSYRKCGCEFIGD